MIKPLIACDRCGKETPSDNAQDWLRLSKIGFVYVPQITQDTHNRWPAEIVGEFHDFCCLACLQEWATVGLDARMKRFKADATLKALCPQVYEWEIVRPAALHFFIDGKHRENYNGWFFWCRPVGDPSHEYLCCLKDLPPESDPPAGTPVESLSRANVLGGTTQKPQVSPEDLARLSDATGQNARQP